MTDQLTLARLEGVTARLLAAAGGFWFPLLASDRRLWRRVLLAFDSFPIQVEMSKLAPAEQDRYWRLIEQLGALAEPDPARRPRLRREISPGDPRVSRMRAFDTVYVPKMCRADVAAVAQEMLDKGKELAALAREVLLATERDEPAARRLSELARKMAATAEALGVRVKRKPALAKRGTFAEAARDILGRAAKVLGMTCQRDPRALAEPSRQELAEVAREMLQHVGPFEQLR